jgi:hypothetical protein
VALMADESIKLEVSHDEASLVVSAIYDKILETERYAQGTPTGEPGSMDTCCELHRRRWEDRKRLGEVMREQEQTLRKVARALEEQLT